jgi:HAMP domain-containing protein
MSHASLILAAVLLFAQGYVIYRQRKMEKIIMSGLTDLQTSVTALTTAVNNIIALVKNADPDATVASIAAQVQAEVDALNAAMAPPPAS